MIQTHGKISLAFGLEELILLKCSYYPKATYRLNVISIKLPMTFFTDWSKCLEFIWNCRRSIIAKAILRKRMKAEVEIF